KKQASSRNLIDLVRQNDYAHVKMMLDQGADPNTGEVTKENQSILDIWREFIERSQHSKLPPESRPVLVIAIEQERPDMHIIQALLDKGADIERTDEYGETALLKAVS